MFHTDYLAPESIEELLAALHQYGSEAKLVAGGTDLIPQMRSGRLSPRLLIDPRLLALGGIIEETGNVRLCPHLTHSQVLSSPLLKANFPALVSACQQVGGPPTRNRGTLAGNLANASPAADSALPLLVFDAQVATERVVGGRIIPLNEFFLAPGKSVLYPDEFISGLILQKMPPHTKAAFIKLGKRQAMAIAVASVAVRLSLDKAGWVKQARIALGSVAPTPIRATQAESILESNPLDEEAILCAAEAARNAASPISDLRASADYRSKMVAVLVKRALQLLRNEFSAEDAHA